MSALSVADEVLKELVALYPSAPAPQWSQLGAPILTCTSTAVGAVSSSEQPLFPDNPRCGVIENHTLTIVIARECGITFDNEGITIPDKVEAVSAMMDADGIAIEELIERLAQDSRVLGLPAQSYLNEGGIAAVSMTVIVTES